MRVVESLRKKGFRVGGLYCPEIRSSSGRLGFKVIELTSGEERILAHVRQKGPRVSKYGVNLQNLEEISRRALETLPSLQVVIIDEIGPMEVLSPAFCQFVRTALGSPKIVLAALHQKTQVGFIGEVKRLPNVTILEVTPEKREELVGEVERRIEELFEQGHK